MTVVDRTDTIFALSSGKLPSGIAVIRLSGGKTRFVLETIAGGVPPVRLLKRAEFRDINGLMVDSGLCVYFGSPKSFTGEDSAEFHVHGSHSVVRKFAEVLSGFEGVRPAEAGEFTRRAFLNGKLDLAEAEGLGDLLIAETEAQRRLALSQSDGSLSNVYQNWRERLVYCRSLVEASIDFSEEDDVSASAVAHALMDVSNLRQEMQSWLERSANSEIVRDGFKVVIVGAPNAGKSSLLNAFAGRDAAIVSDEPGTTRDLMDVRLDLGGNLVIVTDTAGIRDEPGKIEAIGIKKAVVRADQADLVILLEDIASPVDVELGISNAKVVRVGNKSDLIESFPSEYDLLISTKTMDGIDRLLNTITHAAQAIIGGENILTVQQRQKVLLSDCVATLSRCASLGSSPDLLAEHLRIATDCIGRLTGHVDVEELLGVIFSRFCIGK